MVPDCTSEYANENVVVPFSDSVRVLGATFACGRCQKLKPTRRRRHVDARRFQDGAQAVLQCENRPPLEGARSGSGFGKSHARVDRAGRSFTFVVRATEITRDAVRAGQGSAGCARRRGTARRRGARRRGRAGANHVTTQGEDGDKGDNDGNRDETSPHAPKSSGRTCSRNSRSCSTRSASLGESSSTYSSSSSS